MGNSIKNILKTAITLSIILSVKFLVQSIQLIDSNNSDFVRNTSLFASVLTSAVIMIYVLRHIYIKEKRRPKLFFSQLPMIIMLIYVTTCIDIIIFNLFSFGVIKNPYIWEHLITVFFAVLCTVAVIVMLKQNINYNRDFEIQSNGS